MDIAPGDKDLVARTILSEAAEDGVRGMAAAAWAIKNRIRSGEFGDSTRKVILKPYAFEPWSLRRNSKNHPLNWSADNPLYKQASYIVDNVWNDKIDDPTGGATHFFSPSAQRLFGRRNPAWSRSPELAEVGHHKFYAPEGGPVPDEDWLAIKAKKQKAPQKVQSAPSEAEDDWLAHRASSAVRGTPKTKEPEPRNFIERLAAKDPDLDIPSIVSGGFTRGIPIAGPLLDEGAKHIAAASRSAIYGTKFQDELKAVNDYASRMQKEHPVAEAAGELGGGITGLATMGLAAPTAMGLAGSLATRMAAGALSGTGINATDAAIRSGGDPYETALGGAIGGTFGLGGPLVGQAIGAAGRKLFGLGQRGSQYLLDEAEKRGIPISAIQTSGSRFLQKTNQMVGQLPFGAGKFDAQQQAAVERAVSNTFGEDTSRITSKEMLAAKKRLGQSFDDLRDRMTVGYDQPLIDKMNDIGARAEDFLEPGQSRIVANHSKNILNKFDEDGTMSGGAYRGLTESKSELSKGVKANTTAAPYLAEMRDALDDAAKRASDPELSAQLTQTKYQYKNMKTIEPLINEGEGISPLSLQKAASKSFRDRAYTGAGDLGAIADIAQAYMKQPRDSGTPAGNMIMGLLTGHGPGVVGALAGAGAGGYASYSGASPWESAGTALLGAASAGAAGKSARLLLDNPALLSGLAYRAPYVAPAVRNALTVDVGVRPGYYQDQQ